jgi:hypothetical protein
MHNDNRIGWKSLAGVLILMLSGLLAEEFPVVADTWIQKGNEYGNNGDGEYVYIRQVSPYISPEVVKKNTTVTGISNSIYPHIPELSVVLAYILM